MHNTENYRPSVFLRSPNVQTILASSKLRNLYCRGFETKAERIVLRAGKNLKTTAYVNIHPDPKGMIVLLHGWLGRPQSSYMLSAAKRLFDAGFSTARLTLPEHAEAALMNGEVVPITRHDFVREAIQNLIVSTPSLPIGVMGFSLGGNVALRIARDMRYAPIPQLKHVFAVSPAIDPESTGAMIDTNPVFRRYFMRKMSKLYRMKIKLFPNLAYMSNILNHKTTLGVTEAFVSYLPEFANLREYFDAYRINVGDFTASPIPVTLISSDDDPIVLSGPARALREGSNFEKIITQYGGHNGFFNRSLGDALSERVVADRFLFSLK